MILELLTLFFSTLLGGLTVIIQRTMTVKASRLILTFSSGYLLAMTLLHLIPGLFISSITPLHIGSYLMAGFFLQRFIEAFSTGVEHGHCITPTSSNDCIANIKIFPFVSSIALHTLLDGAILAHRSEHMHANGGLLFGMMLHKFLEAFALMSVLRNLQNSIGRNLFYLVLFSLASPLGLWLSNYTNDYLSNCGSIILLAIVTGNFLYISTTMLFESSPDHNSSRLTTWVSLLGASLASLIEFLS